jgi:hypothetical protein
MPIIDTRTKEELVEELADRDDEIEDLNEQLAEAQRDLESAELTDNPGAEEFSMEGKSLSQMSKPELLEEIEDLESELEEKDRVLDQICDIATPPEEEDEYEEGDPDGDPDGED